jgi:hypothetical protein
MIAFTKSLARETARYHITVNCVCPGPTDTPLFAAQPEKVRIALEKAIPFRRIAKPQELADAILFLRQPAFRLRNRPGAQCQRRPDDGRIALFLIVRAGPVLSRRAGAPRLGRRRPALHDLPSWSKCGFHPVPEPSA